MVDLMLTGPYTSISAYGCFAIKIDIPGPYTSTGNAGGSIKWEWDCYDSKYAEEVDKGPVTRTISSSGPGRNVEVTYAVMSNAVKATVQVKLRINDGRDSPCSVHGNISARIGDFKQQSILFRRTQETAQRFSPTDSRVLQLARSVVAVPCGGVLHIDLHLQIETSNNQGVKRHFNTTVTLSFPNGTLSQAAFQRHQVDGGEVEVDVTCWYPDSFSSEPSRPGEEFKMRLRQPDISYTIGDDGEGFSTFITELRRLVADHPLCKDLMADHPELSSTRNHPVLRSGRVITRDQLVLLHDRLFHLKLQAVDEGVEETSSITLVIRNDNLDVIGFMNQSGVCYSYHTGLQLPKRYRSKHLARWDQEYGITMNARSPELDQNILASKELDKTFAEDAVRELSRFDPDPKVRGARDNPGRALLGLRVMVCDSARMNPVHLAVAGGWNNGTKFTKELMDYMKNWLVISGVLLDWRDHAYQGWPQNTTLESIGIMSPEDALKVVSLVFNDSDRICKCTRY